MLAKAIGPQNTVGVIGIIPSTVDMAVSMIGRKRALFAVFGTKHNESYFDIVMAGIVGAIIALAAVIGLGSIVGSF